jgi:hypothetical protein
MHTTLRLWDAQALKEHRQAANERAEHAQSQQDWQRATIYVERAVSDKRGLSGFCRLPACRRARGCRGNPTLCLPADAGKSARAQDAIDFIYVQIQEQRWAATVDGRKLDWLDPVTRKLPGRR